MTVLPHDESVYLPCPTHRGHSFHKTQHFCSCGGSHSPIQRFASDALVADADAAYNREDQAWFNAQTTEVLTALWGTACDITRGAAWDDEVYEALADRGHFGKEST